MKEILLDFLLDLILKKPINNVLKWFCKFQTMCDAEPPLCRRRWWTCAAIKAVTVRWLEYSAAAVVTAAIGWSIPRTTKGWLCKHVNIIETIRSLSDKFCYLMMVSSAFQLMLLLVLCYKRARAGGLDCTLINASLAIYLVSAKNTD